MTKFNAQNNMSDSAQPASDVRSQARGAADIGVKDADNADNAENAENASSAEAGAQSPSGPVRQEAAPARAPRGPFKIMTIPQAWYDSLHAASTSGGGAGKKRG